MAITRRLEMIYPERRMVTEQTVRSWAADLATDRERDARGGVMCEDEAERVWRRLFDAMTVDEAIALIEDDGAGTFKRRD